MALVEGTDYYIDKTGLLVFTETYLLARGFCCDNGCRHCPYRKDCDSRVSDDKDTVVTPD